MRLRQGLVPLGGIALTVSAALLLLADRQVTRDVYTVSNDLCIVAPATPYDPASGLPMVAPRPVPAGARCPVCGMYPARFPRWAAQTIFKDGSAHYFDSPVDLFNFLHRVDHYDRRYTRDDVAASYASDFETAQWIEAGKAFYVQGSAAAGPMRNADLPAFASRDAANRFRQRHGGTVRTSAELTPQLLQSLHGDTSHRH